MCCLKNEEETYEYLNSRLPGVGDTVTTATGETGEVQSVNVLRQKVKVLIEVDDEKELHEYDVDELKFRPRRKNVKLSAKELEELEGLADEEIDASENKQVVRPELENQDEHREDNRDQNRERRDRDRNKDRQKNRDRKDVGRDKERDGESRAERENRDQNQRRNHHYRNRNKKDRGDRTNAGGDRQSSESKSS